MSETEVLRRLLDERGVEWVNTRNDGSKSDYFTEWQFDGIEGHAIATEWAVGHLTVCIAHPMSPEQAIAATLGPCNCTNGERTGERIDLDAPTPGVTDARVVRLDGAGTCHVMTIGEFNGEGTEYYDYCSNCGYEFFDDDPLNYCPNCGRRIEVDDG